MPTTRSGFTLVELLIVIVVIGILAAITLVAYNGVQQKARDSAVRQATSQLASALQRYAILYGTPSGFGSNTTTPISGGQCTGGSSSGWLEPTTYSCAIGDMLVAANLLPSNFFTDLPSGVSFNGSNRYVFMLYPCSGKAGQFRLMYALSSPSDSDTQGFVSVDQQCGISSPLTADGSYTTWGMRASQLLNLNQ